jgi:hypothetical protein
MELTPAGFVHSLVPRASMTYAHGDNRSEYWDLFPSSPDLKEFLFEVLSPTGLTRDNPVCPAEFIKIANSDV